MNSVNDKIIKLAADMCKSIDRQKRHVSIIHCKGKIVAVGNNYFKTHPKAKKIGYRYEEMHSELDAFRKVSRDLRDKKLHLVNIRFNRFGEMRMSKPCDLCMPWCLDIFESICYTTDQGIVSL